MFLHTMTQTEKLAFVGLARAIVEADGVTHEAERELLRAIALEAGARIEDVPPRVVDDTLIEAFPTPRSRRAAMLELMGIAFADGSMHRSESAVITDVARQFKIADEDVIWMNRWVARQVGLAAEAERFLAQEGD